MGPQEEAVSGWLDYALARGCLLEGGAAASFGLSPADNLGSIERRPAEGEEACTGPIP